MKKRLQIILIHVVVGLLVFLLSLAFFDYRINLHKGSPMAELAGSTYPVMEIASDHGDYNLMKAYSGEIDLSLVRNQISILEDSGILRIKLHCYDYDITAVQYTLFTDNPDAPVEEGTVNQLEDEGADKVRGGNIQFTSDLKEGENYFLRMAVRLDNSTRAWFYTRLQTGHPHYKEYLTFAKDFHKALLDREDAHEKIGVYLETDANDTSYNLQHVDIHSNFNSVVYGNMIIKEETEPRLRIREINDTYAVVELSSVLSSEIKSNVIQNYDVREVFKIRYNPERMFLLDYNRYMNARYSPEFIDSSRNYLGLGIQSADQIRYFSSKDGYLLSFVSAGQLWFYEYKTSNVTRVYSFITENLADLRNDQEEHGMKILDMDEHGNITYLVCGYMSRGRHEGANGIQILRYDAEKNCNEEMAFLLTSVPYNSMEEDLERLSYLNDDDVFYCLLDGDLHEIHLKERKDNIIRSGLYEDSLTASVDHSIIALEKEPDITANTEIEVISLKDGQSRSYTCKESRRIRSVGFLNNDFIYASAKASDVSREESGAVVFPATSLIIMNEEGGEERRYQKKKRYITGTNIEGSVLDMEFAKKVGNTFIKTDDKDYIRYKEEGTPPVTLATRMSDDFGEQLYFSFPDYVYIQIAPDLRLTKFLTSEDDLTLKLERSNEGSGQYFVYAGGEKKQTFTNLPGAVMKASELRGNVFDDQEHIIWECAFNEYDIVAGMDNVVKVKSDNMSLPGSLSMIAALNGKNMTPDEIARKPGLPVELLEVCTGKKGLSLTGCSLDDVLYYISQGSPVLAKYSGTRFVVVMSYNSTNIRYLDPVTGKSTVEGRAQITERFKKHGNVFYSYLDK